MDEPKRTDPRIDELVQSVTDPFAGILSADAVDCMQAVLHAVYASNPAATYLVDDIVAPPAVDTSEGISRDASAEDPDDKRGSGTGA
jgi:hypothetical protein